MRESLLAVIFLTVCIWIQTLPVAAAAENTKVFNLPSLYKVVLNIDSILYAPQYPDFVTVDKNIVTAVISFDLTEAERKTIMSAPEMQGKASIATEKFVTAFDLKNKKIRKICVEWWSPNGEIQHSQGIVDEWHTNDDMNDIFSFLKEFVKNNSKAMDENF